MTVLDKFLKGKRAEISSLKAKRRKEKTASKKAEWDRPIQEKELFVRKFMKSKMEPAKAGNIIINNKIYEQFIKKLKGFEVDISIEEDKLVLQYGKIQGEWTGVLELYDLSSHFNEYGEVTKEADLLWPLM